jgi:hypothetical protein
MRLKEVNGPNGEGSRIHLADGQQPLFLIKFKNSIKSPFCLRLRRFRRRRSNNGQQAGSARPSPELEELREKMPMQKGSVGEYHESGTLPAASVGKMNP